MRRKTRLEFEMETFRKALHQSPLAKLTQPDRMAAFTKYAEGATAHIIAEWNAALRKGANVADRSEIMRKAAESYYAAAPNPLAEIEAEIETLTKSMDKMRAAFPAWRRQVLQGIEDPNGIDEPRPPRDPDEPVIDLGRFVIAEKAFTFDRATGRQSEQTYTPFPMPPQKQPPRDLNAGAVESHLRHRRDQQ
jgi:hypothetical protein